MLRAAFEHSRSQRELAAATVAAVRREWARMGDDLDAAWTAIAPRVVRIVTAAQFGSASVSTNYVATALDQQGVDVRPEAAVRPLAFTGVATDLEGLTYGSLDALLYGAVVHARTTNAQSLDERLLAGRKWLDAAVQTQVADAGRMAASTAITAHPRTGWVRMVTPPCCKRCAPLAGAFYRHNRGFQRHPNCDCTHIPATEATADGVGIVIGPDDIKDLTKAQRRAIDDGADMNQVLNSDRGRSKDRLFTTEGATRRGVAGKRLGAAKGKRARRLTPEGIYQQAGDDRDEALRLLKSHGYIF